MAELVNSDMQPDESASDTNYDFFCQFCSSDGKHLEAQGYCNDCREYLCANCCHNHVKVSITRHHTVLGKDAMPTDRIPDTASDVCIEMCAEHKGKVVEYYCSNHNLLCCSVCVTLCHKDCTTEYIPCVAQNDEHASEYSQFKNKLSNIDDCTENMLKAIEKNVDRCEMYGQRARRAWKDFRQEILSALAKAEKELMADIDKKKSEDVSKMESLSETCKEILINVKTTSSKFQNLSRNKVFCQMYTFVKRERCGTERLQELLDEVSSQATIQHYKFVPNVTLLKHVDNAKVLGEFDVRSPKRGVKTEYVGDILVKSDTDLKPCWITGSVLLPDGKLAIVDHSNAKVKLLNIKECKVVEEINMPCKPFDMTVMNDYEIAVSSTSTKQIHILNAENGLKLTHEIAVKTRHRGICFHRNKFISIDKDNETLEILNIYGETVIKIDHNLDSIAVFQNPFHCSVSSNGQFIYVTDFQQNSVVVSTMNGTIQKNCTRKGFQGPLSMSVDPVGALYVISKRDQTIKMLTKDLDYIGTILQLEIELSPSSLCYREDDDRLFIGFKNSDVMKVYQIQSI